jgi:hypothetical protein
VTKPLHLNLTGVGERAGFDQLTGAHQKLLLAGTSDLMLKFVADVEVILQCPLTTTCHDCHVL